MSLFKTLSVNFQFCIFLFIFLIVVHLLLFETTAVEAYLKVEQSHSNNYASFDDSIYYKINWPGKSLDHPEIAKRSDEEATIVKNNEPKVAVNAEPFKGAKLVVQDDNTLWITTKRKEKYRCILPKIALQQGQDENDDKDEEEELSPYQLLKPLFVREVCSYRLEQYWTYELCHGRFIRQFHEESTVTKISSQEYILGKFDISNLAQSEKNFNSKLEALKKEGKKRPTVAVDDLQLPYIEVNMTGGTMCDLSNTPRLTRVFYVCNEDAKHELFSIKETSTCEYEAIVFSPLLCLHSDFRVMQHAENDISCYPVEKSPYKPLAFKNFEPEKTKKKKPVERLDDKDNPFPGLFDGKTIIIGATEFGKELRINIIADETMKNSVSKNLPSEPENAYRSAKAVDFKIVQEFLKGERCLRGGSSWWRYEFCYGSKVDQYHEEKDVRTATINLGKWNEFEHKKWLHKHPSKKPKPNKTPRSISHFYGNGDICDITGRPRQVEVKLKCKHIEGHPDSVALYLLEPKTCEYVLGIESPLLCELMSTVDENGLLHLPEEVVEPSLSSAD